MKEVSLTPGPRWRDVLLEQIRVVTIGLRAEALIVAAVLGAGTFMIGMELAQGGRGFDSNETFPTAVIGFLFPFAVWRGVKRFGADFLWTLPVDRRRLALARVLAGGVWLMGAVGLFALWLGTLSLIADAPVGEMLARIPFTATAGAYFVGSAILLGLRHPARWLFGIACVVLLLGGLGDLVHDPDGREWRFATEANAFVGAVYRAVAPFRMLPSSAQGPITALLWFGFGLAALWLALLRHRERYRPDPSP
jgi:hypothetical protein